MRWSVWIFCLWQEVFTMKEELTGADYRHSVIIGSLLGFFVGWAVGVALLLYLGSKELNSWPLVWSVPLWYGLGWATYGMVIGGGGAFARWGRKRSGPEKEESIKPAA